MSKKSTPRSHRGRGQPTPPTKDSSEDESSSGDDRIVQLVSRAAKKKKKKKMLMMKPSLGLVLAIVVALISVGYRYIDINHLSSKVTSTDNVNKFTNLFSSDKFVLPAWLREPLKLFPLTRNKGKSPSTDVENDDECIVCKKKLVSEPRPSEFSQQPQPLKSSSLSTYQRTTEPYPVELNTAHDKYMKAHHDTGIVVSGPPYCQLLMPNNPHVMYNTQHMYQYGDHAGVYFCYPPSKGPFKWRVIDNTYTHAGGKSGRCTNCESYYCKKFSCDIAKSFLCNDCGDSSDSDGSDNEGAADDDCCYEDPSDCYMIYKHDHSVKAKIQPLHDLYLNAPLKYGLKVKDYMKLTDREALELEKELGGITLFHILEVDMFNGIEDENHPLYSNGRKVEGHDKGLILSGVETIIQLMITQAHAGRVNEHLHSNDIRDLVKQRDDIEKSHTEHLQIDIPLIFLRPSPHPKIRMPTSLPEIKMHHEIDTSSWPAKADETDEGKDKASTNKHTKSRPWTPFTYDMHWGPDTFGTKAVNLYDRPRDYDGDYKFYSINEHKEAYKRLLNNMDRCTTTVQSKTEPQFNGVFCRYDENESVLFKALQEIKELQHLIKDYKGIKVPDDRMMTRLLIHRTGAKVYRTDGGLTYLYSRNEDCQVTLHQVHSPPGIAVKSYDIANPPSQYKNGFTLQHNRDQDNVMIELESSVTFTHVLFDPKRFNEKKQVKIPREIFGTFLPAGKYRLYCLNNTHGSPMGCTKVTKSMILAPFGIRHLQRPGLDGEFHSQKERSSARNEETRVQSTRDTLLGEEAISCLSSAHYAEDIDSFINDLADRIVKRDGAMWMQDPSKDDNSSVYRSKTEVDNIIDNMEVFNCPVGDQDSICEKLRRKCHEKLGEKKNAYWQQQKRKAAEVSKKAEEGNKRRKTDE